jgi:hypothetical protein
VRKINIYRIYCKKKTTFQQVGRKGRKQGWEKWANPAPKKGKYP